MKFSDFKLEKNSDGLLPVIVQDACTGKVLMLAYMNEAAFDKTVERNSGPKGRPAATICTSKRCTPTAMPIPCL